MTTKMEKKDYEYLLGHWKHLVEQLTEINESLIQLVETQQKTMLKLQSKQTKTSKEEKQ